MAKKARSKTVVNPKTGRKKTVRYGQAGKAADGGPRVRPGTAKGGCVLCEKCCPKKEA